jgi:glycosyltransferase involved in cell wall biosynthesis
MRVSVYITSYNQRNYLIEAIESILVQTLAPSQIIIVDDGSEDGSQKVISEYASRYPSLIIPIFHSENHGIARTRNDALRSITGDFVTYLDGDDRFLPEKIEKELYLLQANPAHQIVFSNYRYIDGKGKCLRVWANEIEAPPSGYVFFDTFSRNFPKNTLFRNEFVNADCYHEVGYYDDRLKTHEDWDMKIRLTKHFSVIFCPDILIEYRIHKKGLSRARPSLRLDSISLVYKKNKKLLKDLTLRQRFFVSNRLLRFYLRLYRQSLRQTLSEKELYRLIKSRSPG